jgi:hypothetical protein
MTGRLRIISRPADAIGQASDPALTRDPGSAIFQLAMHAERLWSVSEGRAAPAIAACASRTDPHGHGMDGGSLLLEA